MNELCECGHRAETHTPCCVSPCGCDSFTPKQLTDADVDAMMAMPDDPRFSSSEWKARMWRKYQEARDREALKRIKMLLRNEDYQIELEDITLPLLEDALRREITAKRNYRGLYGECLQHIRNRKY